MKKGVLLPNKKVLLHEKNSNHTEWDTERGRNIGKKTTLLLHFTFYKMRQKPFKMMQKEKK